MHKYFTFLAAFMMSTTCVLSSAAGNASAIFDVASPTVVTINSFSSTNKRRNGSGVIIKADNVLTNCHVVLNSLKIEVMFSDGKTVAAELLGRYGSLDLCLLAASSDGRRVAKIANSESIRIGNPTFAIGAPLGLQRTISDGIVSGIREVTGSKIIQTTAPISPGSSGGGLFNENGNLIAITTATFASGQNINFAIPADYAQLIPLFPITLADSQTPDISFKGLAFGATREVFLGEFPGATCQSQNAVSITCKGKTNFFGSDAEFTTFIGPKGMYMVYIRIYSERMDDLFTDSALTLADRFKWWSEARPGSTISWDIGGKKEQGIFLIKCDGKNNCLMKDIPGIMIFITDFRLQPPKVKDF